jgi:hypothetical protein
MAAVIALAALTAVAGCAGGSTSITPTPSRPTVPGYIAATLGVVNVSTQGLCGASRASGWVAGRDLVVTEAPAVIGATDDAVSTSDGHTLPATLAYYDGADEVAVLRVPGLDAGSARRPVLEPASAGAALRQTVWLLGLYDPSMLSATPATVVSVSPLLVPATLDQIAILVQPAEEFAFEVGGPVVNDAGAVVGMKVGATASGSDVVVSVRVIEAGLARAERAPVGLGAALRAPCPHFETGE